MAAIDTQHHYLFSAAQTFDTYYGFCRREAELSRLLTRLIFGAVQRTEGGSPWPQGLKEAFSHNLRDYLETPGAVEWLRDVAALKGAEWKAADKWAEVILDKIDQTPDVIERKVQEVFHQKAPAMGLEDQLKSDFPHAFALLQEIFLTNLQIPNRNESLISLAEPLVDTWDLVTIKMRICSYRVQMLVSSLFKHSSRLTWSVAIAFGILLLPPFYLVSYGFWAICLIGLLEVCSLVAFETVLIDSFSTLTLSTIALCPSIIAVIFSLHAIATASVYLVDWGCGGVSPRLHRACTFAMAWGLNPVLCLVHLFILGFPFSLSAVSSLNAYIFLKWEWPTRLEKEKKALETQKTSLAFKMFLRCGAIFCESLPKEGLEPTPGCPE